MASLPDEQTTENSTLLFTLQWVPRFADHLTAMRDYWRTRFVRKLEIGMSIFMAAIALLIVVLTIRTHDNTGGWLALGAFGIAIFFWFSFTMIFIPLIWIGFRVNPRVRDPYTVHIEEEYIRINTPMSDLRLSWSYYQRVIEGRHTFLLVAEHNFISMIPKRAFSNEEAIASFREFLARIFAR